jgi:RNA polymerase sigma factor (sigma-70 family)
MSHRSFQNYIPYLRRSAAIRDGAGLTDGQLLRQFIHDRDEAAFESLVRRHAAMVYSVCRRVIGDEHSAEDAFQAVFLILARRAACVRPLEQVGNWLYGVAYRTALRAKAGLARYRSREKQVLDMPHPQVLPPEMWNDVQLVLDEELAQLPDKLRLALVLCDLEGRPQREVAKQLNLPPTTLFNRLSSARRLLAAQLNRRGIALSGGALATLLTAHSAQAIVPMNHILSAAKLASANAQNGLATAISAEVVQLSEGVMRMMFLSKLRIVTSLFLAVVLFVGGSYHLAAATDPDRPGPSKNADGYRSPSARPSARKLDDREYLKRLCLELRGKPASEVELDYFVRDPDPSKRATVTELLLAEKDAQASKTNWLDDLYDLSTRQTLDSYLRPSEIQGIPKENEKINADIKAQWQQMLNPTNQSDAIDEFVRRKINKLATSADVNDKAQEIRRKYLDVMGETPTPEQVRRYVSVWEVNLDLSLAEWMDQSWYADWERSAVKSLAPEAAKNLLEELKFFRRVCRDARGSDPTLLELEYFKADKDPKKKEKVLDLFLKDPALAKKLGDGWKRQMLQSEQDLKIAEETRRKLVELQRVRAFMAVMEQVRKQDGQKEKVPDQLVQLLDQLLKQDRSEEQVLEALATATTGRLPTESEKKLALSNLSKQADKRASWLEVLKSFTGTEEAKQYAEALQNKKEPPKKAEPNK